MPQWWVYSMSKGKVTWWRTLLQATHYITVRNTISLLTGANNAYASVVFVKEQYSLRTSFVWFARHHCAVWQSVTAPYYNCTSIYFTAISCDWLWPIVLHVSKLHASIINASHTGKFVTGNGLRAMKISNVTESINALRVRLTGNTVLHVTLP